MKLQPISIFYFLLFLSSCIYDPTSVGKEFNIYNQTDQPIMVLDSLTAGSFFLYDTATVNGRKFISRRQEYIPDHGMFTKIILDGEIKDLKRKKVDKITLYVVNQKELDGCPKTILSSNSYRSIDIDIDRFKMSELNYLFITNDSILWEHGFDYYTIRTP